MNFQCHKNDADPTFYQVVTLQVDLEVDYSLTVADNLTIYLNVDNLSLKFIGYTDNTVKVNKFYAKTAFTVAGPAIEGIINSKTKDGLSIIGLIDKTKLGFFNLTELAVENGDDFFVVGLKP